MSNISLYFPQKDQVNHDLVESLAGSPVVPRRNDAGVATRYDADLGDLHVELELLPSRDLDEHLVSLCAYIQQGLGEDSVEQYRDLFEFILRAEMVYHCHFHPDHDSTNRGKMFVVDLARATHAVIFAHSSLYNWDGHRIAGPANDPTELIDDHEEPLDCKHQVL